MQTTVDLFAHPEIDRTLLRKICAIIACTIQNGNELWLELDATASLPPHWLTRLSVTIHDPRHHIHASAPVRALVARRGGRHLIASTTLDHALPDLALLSLDATVEITSSSGTARFGLPLRHVATAAH